MCPGIHAGFLCAAWVGSPAPYPNSWAAHHQKPIQCHVGAVVQNVSILHASLNWMMIRTHQRTAIHSGWVGTSGRWHLHLHPPVSARIRTYPHVSARIQSIVVLASVSYTAHSCSLEGRLHVRDFGRTQPFACALAYTPGSCALPGWGLLRRIQIHGRHIARGSIRASVLGY